MKKSIFPAAIAAIVLVSCQKEKDDSALLPIETFTKVIQFSFAQAKSYADPIFDGVEANMRINVSKVSKKDGAMVELWDTTIANQSIRLYPLPNEPLLFTKSFSGIKDGDENISVSYWIGYKDRNNHISGVGKNDFAPAGNSVFYFHVRL